MLVEMTYCLLMFLCCLLFEKLSLDGSSSGKSREEACLYLSLALEKKNCDELVSVTLLLLCLPFMCKTRADTPIFSIKKALLLYSLHTSL